MDHFSYIEVNLLCIILLLIAFQRLHQNRFSLSSSQRYMRRLIMVTVLMCVADIVAILSRGRVFCGARAIIQISNLVYFVCMPTVSFLWLKYIYARTHHHISKFKKALLHLPLIAFALFALGNPLHNILFSVNEANLYVRGSGVPFHWVISLFYFFVATVETARSYLAAPTSILKNKYRPLLLFLFWPTISCVIQILFYGISTIGAGITIAIILVNFKTLDLRISVDEVTGINNRRQLMPYIELLLARHKSQPLTVMMMDINKFKQINDNYGHIFGDEALRQAAAALREVCESLNERAFLCRYGGDEFVLISTNTDAEYVADLTARLTEAVSNAALEDSPYDLSISVGSAVGVCDTVDDFLQLIHQADEKMYTVKSHSR